MKNKFTPSLYLFHLRLIDFARKLLGIDDRGDISQVVHFDTRVLFEDRFDVGTILTSLETASSRFPEIEKFFLLSDIKTKVSHPKLITLTSGGFNKLLSASPKEDTLVFILAFNSDEKSVLAVKKIKRREKTYYFGASHPYPAARFFHTNEIARKSLIKSIGITKNKLGGVFYLSDYENLVQAIYATRYLKGDYVEIGVFKGKSAIVALEFMRAAGIRRKSYFFDLFTGFTQESSLNSSDALFYKTHTETSLNFVQKLLKPYSNKIVKKIDIITDNIPKEIKTIALVNLDVDIYEAVAAALKKIDPLLVKGGIIICEDYGHTPLLVGAMVAVDEFLESNTGKKYIPIYMRSGEIFLHKFM